MALKNCLYCRAPISELALDCPRCHASDPFDSNKKAAHEKLEAVKQREKAKLESLYACQECGSRRSLSEVFKRSVCPSCGYPKMGPDCSLCSKRASLYDNNRGEIVCGDHFIEECSHCRTMITDGDKVGVPWRISCGGGGIHRYHRKCHSDNRTKEGVCFIATSAYGDCAAPEVMTLRRYRDEVLHRFAIGRIFIKAYYRISPPIALAIGRSPILSKLARGILDPLIRRLDKRQH